MRKINRAVKIRIYPNKEQITQIEKTIGCSRFLYNRMLADKIRYYQEEKKMLKNTPAGYKKEYPWLKEVDSLALANVQLNLEGAFRKFFREPGVGFPHYKSKKHSRKSYTTNMVNGNICLQDRFLKLPKMQPVKIKLHRMIPEGWKLKSVTVSRDPSGKYFASLLFDCENQTAEKRQAKKFLGIDFAMHGMCVFSTGERAGWVTLQATIAKIPESEPVVAEEIIEASETIVDVIEPMKLMVVDSSNINQISFEVSKHIRKLQKGWKPSSVKVETAAENGIHLLQNQTWVTDYMKGGAVA